jgi:hypothetical protein
MSENTDDSADATVQQSTLSGGSLAVEEPDCENYYGACRDSATFSVTVMGGKMWVCETCKDELAEDYDIEARRLTEKEVLR